jgi:hypothetical protein
MGGKKGLFLLRLGNRNTLLVYAALSKKGLFLNTLLVYEALSY